ncbi:hypothetical protein ACFX12_020228 [Malus domestica]
MSTTLHAKLACIEIERLFDVPKSTLSKHQRKWRYAFATIYCSRAFNLSLPKYKNTKTSPSPSYTAISVEPSYSLFQIDQTTLTNLVKQKNLNQLQELGGVEEIATALKTDAEHGVHGGDDPEGDIAKRLKAFGSNTYKKPPTKGFFHFVWEAFKDLTILILLGCATLSLGLGIKVHGLKDGWIDGGSIFLAIILVISVSAVSNFRQNRQFDKLSKVSDNVQIEAVRGGRRQQISIFEIVVGDVICLKIGDQVPADGLFLDGHSLQVDESSMTGESDHVEISQHQNPFLFSGTKVADGYARMLVTSVGMNTTWGEMMSQISRDNGEETPLQARLNKLTSSIGKVGLVVAFLVLIVLMVTKFWLGEEPVEEEAYSSISPFVRNLIHEGVALNTTGSVFRPNSGSEIEISGSPTEKAILSWAVHGAKMDMRKMVKSCSILYVEAFNSQKKRSGVLMKRKVDDSVQAHWKGAAEMVLAMCTSYYNASGVVKDMDENAKLKFEQIIQGMAASSLRCIAFAHTEIEVQEQVDDQEHKNLLKEDGLTLLGLVGLKDPCRPGVKKAVEDCQRAGVNVKMITGDNVFTAKAIATECGILKPDQDMFFSGAVIEGVQFRNYTPEERMEKVDKICVMARSSPFDKLLMVQCLKQLGHVVAVTGDGTNDAPALKEADIGLSMGIQGTEVAKESSDIVIMDDNFSSVATVLRWGRCVYENIQKFIQFQLTVNVAALVINFVAAISAGEVPLTAVQLLWVNLIMDTLGALALATEKPAKELMKKKPVGRTEPLITNIMWRNLLPQALYQIAILLTLQFKGKSIFGVEDKVKDTLIFNTFVLCQVFNEFNARKLEKKNVFRGIHTNKLFLGIIGVTILLQVVMVEFLKKFADTERLNWGQWAACVGIAAVSWPIGWIVKSIPVPETPIFSYLKMKKSKKNSI